MLQSIAIRNAQAAPYFDASKLGPAGQAPAGDFYPNFHHFKLQQSRNTNDDSANDQVLEKKNSSLDYSDYSNEVELMNIELSKRTNLQGLIELDDIFMAVKTTQKFHQSRVQIILETWFTLAPQQIYFFTDTADAELSAKTGGHVINTNCSEGHAYRSLCCKTSVEFDTYLSSNKRWFCHFDDDNYVNVPLLLDFLRKYDYRKDQYLGRPSVSKGVNIHLAKSTESVHFYFATFGAGFCISRSLALKMKPFVSGGKLTRVCDAIKLPDDVTLGYIIENRLNKKLTRIDEFHSHLEPLRRIPSEAFRDQLTLSYGLHSDPPNTVEISEPVIQDDPSKLKAVHCLLYPETSYCPKQR